VPKAEAARSSLRVQTVAHAFTRDTLFRYAEALAQSLHIARAAELVGETFVAIGDCSGKAGLDERTLEALRDVLAVAGSDLTEPTLQAEPLRALTAL